MGLMVSAACLHAQNMKPFTFSIKGSIADPGEPAKVVLMYAAEGKRASDTVQLEKGNFSFKGETGKPIRGILMLLKQSDNPRMTMAMDYSGDVVGRDALTLYLDKGAISVQGKTLKESVVKGSAAHKDFELLRSKQKPVVDKLKGFQDEMVELSKKGVDRKDPAYEALADKLMKTFKEQTPIDDEFVRTHPDSWVSWNMLADKSIISNPESFKTLYNGMSAKFRNSEEGAKVTKKLDIAFRTAIGQYAPDFTQNNTAGTPVSLASLKGKYVLIDFWASWCGPCRAENPNVKKAYEKFKGKNFEILAVSLDNKKDAWEKAIADDGLSWLHVSDLKGWNNVVAELYNVKAVPQNWLIDPDGKIIAVNMRGAELDERLSALVK